MQSNKYSLKEMTKTKDMLENCLVQVFRDCFWYKNYTNIITNLHKTKLPQKVWGFYHSFMNQKQPERDGYGLRHVRTLPY